MERLRTEKAEWTERKQICLQRRQGRCKEICMRVHDLWLSLKLQSGLNQILQAVIYFISLTNEFK